MKYLSIILILLFAVCLSACGNKYIFSDKDEKVSSYITESSPTESHATAFDDTRMLAEKLEFYNTNICYKDIIVPHRYLIINRENVCLATFFENAETATEIKRTAITSVESKAAGELTVIKITDNSGKEISFNYDTKASAEILKSLKGND